jgi:hypothetical protein
MNAKADDLGFEHVVRKNGEVVILHHGHQAAILRGRAARKLLALVDAGTDCELQQAMARLTGNYRRGNERQMAGHPRNQVV